MNKTYPLICANCIHWNCFDVDYEFQEDECGNCRKKNGKVTFSDDKACNSFEIVKRIRVRAEDYWT